MTQLLVTYQYYLPRNNSKDYSKYHPKGKQISKFFHFSNFSRGSENVFVYLLGCVVNCLHYCPLVFITFFDSHCSYTGEREHQKEKISQLFINKSVRSSGCYSLTDRCILLVTEPHYTEVVGGMEGTKGTEVFC